MNSTTAPLLLHLRQLLNALKRKKNFAKKTKNQVGALIFLFFFVVFLWVSSVCVVGVLWVCCGCVVGVLWVCCGCVVGVFLGI